jgi:hypothetical protein
MIKYLPLLDITLQTLVSVMEKSKLRISFFVMWRETASVKGFLSPNLAVMLTFLSHAKTYTVYWRMNLVSGGLFCRATLVSGGWRRWGSSRSPCWWMALYAATNLSHVQPEVFQRRQSTAAYNKRALASPACPVQYMCARFQEQGIPQEALCSNSWSTVAQEAWEGKWYKSWTHWPCQSVPGDFITGYACPFTGILNCVIRRVPEFNAHCYLLYFSMSVESWSNETQIRTYFSFEKIYS